MIKIIFLILLLLIEKKILEFELRNKGIDDIKKNMGKLVLNQ
jgi:hypothetical protein